MHHDECNRNDQFQNYTISALQPIAGAALNSEDLHASGTEATQER
jgi:hypothetical protein